MKNKILILFIVAMLAIVPALAIEMPHPVYGKVFGAGNIPVYGVSVEVKNLNTGVAMASGTDKDGGYVVDLANYGGYNSNDILEIKVAGCVKCVQRTVVGKLPGTSISDFTDVYIEPTVIVKDGEKEVIKEVVTEVVKEYFCHDGSKVSDPIKCPAISPQTITVEIEKPVFICEDGSKVTKSSDCPVGGLDWMLITWSAIAGMILALCGRYAWAKGFVAMQNAKIKKAKTDEEKKKALETATKAGNTVIRKYK